MRSRKFRRRLGITVVYVTHDQTEAMAMSDRIILINQGIVQQADTPAEIYNHPVNPFVADFLGKVDFARGEASEGRILLDGTDQFLPYDGNKRGPVQVAVRPERITLSLNEGNPGALRGNARESRFYLGDVHDCWVQVGRIPFRGDCSPEASGTMN